MLKGASGIYAASKGVEQSEFRAYMESSQVVLEYPSLRGVAFVERFERGNLAVWLAPGGGLLSAVLAWIVWLLASGRANALMLAGRMTIDLANERQQLVNIVEGTNIATWVWHVRTGVLQLDERWAVMMGYDFAKLEPRNMSDWSNRMHPDDTQAFKAALQRHFRSETRYFEQEHRVRHRDGRWVWVLNRGKVSSWTPEGRPEVMSGTQLNTTDKLHGILQAMPDGSVQYANPFHRQIQPSAGKSRYRRNLGPHPALHAPDSCRRQTDGRVDRRPAGAGPSVAYGPEN